MRKLNDIRTDKPIHISALRHDLDSPIAHGVSELNSIKLEGNDVILFLNWAGQEGWSRELEADLQCVADDMYGFPLLSTWMPLINFRESFCAGGRQMQDQNTKALMERIRSETRSWRDSGCDLVAIDGYWKGHS